MRIQPSLPSDLRADLSPPQVIYRAILILTGLVGIFAIASPHAWGQASRSDYPRDIPPATRGFVIINGRYLAPPYAIDLINGELKVNDVVVKREAVDLTQFELEEAERREAWENTRHSSWGSDRWQGRRRFRPFQPLDLMDVLWDACHATAHMNGVVVLADGQRPLLLEHTRSAHDLLVALLKKSGDNLTYLGKLESTIKFADAREEEAWQRAIDDFQPTLEFANRARKYVGDVVDADDTGEKIVKASLWADSISYPLTLFAMVIVVVAFGHLLSNKPCLETGQGVTTVSPETRKVVLKSLLIFGLLSAVDLIWTLAANATGSMREMNPIGNEFIHDPSRLILFKTLAVSLTIALLYSLHRRPIAQVASWWSCLVLTLLTARWLTFNSMFM